MDYLQKAKEAIMKAEKTDRVIITELQFSVSNAADIGSIKDRRNWTQIDADAVVGEECRRMHYQMLWDGQDIHDVAGCSLAPIKSESHIQRDRNEKNKI